MAEPGLGPRPSDSWSSALFVSVTNGNSMLFMHSLASELHPGRPGSAKAQRWKTGLAGQTGLPSAISHLG